jgi:hypothetical protein
MHLLLGSAVDLVDPGFEVGRSALLYVLIGVDTDVLTMPENMSSVTRALI